jgi:hypothetical protein
VKIYTFLLCLPVSLCLAGCAAISSRPVTVILQHPQTMEFVNCDVDHWNMPASYDKNDKCVEEYKKKGFVVWGTR